MGDFNELPLLWLVVLLALLESEGLPFILLNFNVTTLLLGGPNSVFAWSHRSLSVFLWKFWRIWWWLLIFWFWLGLWLWLWFWLWFWLGWLNGKGRVWQNLFYWKWSLP